MKPESRTGRRTPSRRSVLVGISAAAARLGLPERAAAITASVSAKDFGARGDGSTDDTAAMTAAHSSGKPVFYPSGTYLFERLQIPGGGILGEGPTSVLQCTDVGSRDAITVIADEKSSPPVTPVFSSFALYGPRDGITTLKTSGRALVVAQTPYRKPSSFGLIEDVVFRCWHTCLDTTNASSFTVRSCMFFFYLDCGMIIANQGDADVGDSTVSACHFFNGNGPYGKFGHGIRQRSSGGTRVSGNKFNGGIGAYKMELEGTTSIFIFTGNSVENCSGEAVIFKNNKNISYKSVLYSQIVISANQFANNERDIVFDQISNFENSSYWDDLSITGNIFVHHGGRESISLSTARRFVIENNLFSGPGDLGIMVANNVQDGSIRNFYSRIRVPVTNLGLRIDVRSGN